MNRSEAIKWLSKCSPMDGSDFADACDFAVDELERTRWIPVSERLPDCDGKYLVYADRNDWGDNKGVFSCEFATGEWVVDSDTFDYITHWMQLPKAPGVE